MTKPYSKTRDRWKLPGICLVALAVAVFVWGLSYKLSLYDPPQASSHHMPAAKLLSNRERPEMAKPQFLELPSAVSLSPLLFCALLPLFLPLLVARKVQYSRSLLRAANSRRRPSFAEIPQYFFRPPPRLR